MREFTDTNGRTWIASVAEQRGPDYKGRLHMVLRPKDGDEADALPLTDVRWNSVRTARRTIDTMSLFELRRRLRIALGRRAA